MSDLSPIDNASASGAALAALPPQTPAPRPRRAFRPGLGTLRPPSQGDTHPTAEGRDTRAMAAPGPQSGRRGALAGERPPPKFGDALFVKPAGAGRKTQAVHQSNHLNPWIPIPWAHRSSTLPNDAIPMDLEAQALAESASLSLHRLCASPGTIVMPRPLDGLQIACIGPKLCINLIDAVALQALGEADLTSLLSALAKSKHTSHWHETEWLQGDPLKVLPWVRSKTLSGTSVLFLHLLAQNHVEAAHMIACKRPVEIALELAERVPKLFTLPLLGGIFGAFVPEVTASHNDPNLDENDQLSALAVLVAAFMSEHAHADPEALEAWTVRLLRRFESAGFDATSANVGLMAGAILAGNLRYGSAIAMRDAMIKKYVWFVVALAFAGLSFVQNSNIDGGLTIGAFLLGAGFDSYWPVRDLSLDINQIEGKLRTKMLKVEMFKDTYDNELMMAWIDNVKKCNGY